MGAVDVVSDDRMSQMREMNSDLMGAACLDPHLEKGELVVKRVDLELRKGCPRAARPYRYLLAITRIPPQRQRDRAVIGARLTVNEGKIFLLDSPIFELLGECLVALAVFGDHNEPTGIFVEAVHDAWPERIAGFQQAEMMKQGVDERSAVDTGTQMTDQAGWFFHHGKSLVLVMKLQRNGFGKGNNPGRFGRRDGYFITRVKRIPCFCGCTVDADETVLYPAANLRSALFGPPLSNKLIQPDTRVIGPCFPTNDTIGH